MSTPLTAVAPLTRRHIAHHRRRISPNRTRSQPNNGQCRLTPPLQQLLFIVPTPINLRPVNPGPAQPALQPIQNPHRRHPACSCYLARLAGWKPALLVPPASCRPLYRRHPACTRANTVSPEHGRHGRATPSPMPAGSRRYQACRLPPAPWIAPSPAGQYDQFTHLSNTVLLPRGRSATRVTLHQPPQPAPATVKASPFPPGCAEAARPDSSRSPLRTATVNTTCHATTGPPHQSRHRATTFVHIIAFVTSTYTPAGPSAFVKPRGCPESIMGVSAQSRKAELANRALRTLPRPSPARAQQPISSGLPPQRVECADWNDPVGVCAGHLGQFAFDGELVRGEYEKKKLTHKAERDHKK